MLNSFGIPGIHSCDQGEKKLPHLVILECWIQFCRKTLPESKMLERNDYMDAKAWKLGLRH